MSEQLKGIPILLSPGELFDKISILQIKKERISDATKLANVNIELNELNKIAEEYINASDTLSNLCNQLKIINEKLWVIEDDIRDCERNSDFSESFIELARSVYFTNDKRAAIKKEINIFLGSLLVEEKSYQSY